MGARYNIQTVYSLGLCLLAIGVLVFSFPPDTQLPDAWVWVVGTLSFMVVWHLGMPLPFVGLVSMERVPQMGLILAFGPWQAAMVNGLAAVIYPFTSRSYAQGSNRVAVVRSLHNTGMEILLMLAGGWCYLRLGGSVPLTNPGWTDAFAIVVASLLMQGLNNTAMVVFYSLEGRDVRSLFTLWYVLSDLLFIPAGVLVALLVARQQWESLWLLIFVILLFLAAFSQFKSGAAGSAGAHAAKAQKPRAGRRLDSVAEDIYHQCKALFRFDQFYLVLLDQARGELDFLIDERQGQRQERSSRPQGSGLFGYLLEQGESLLVADWGQAPDWVIEKTHQVTHHGSVIAVPLKVGDESIGVVSVQNRNPGVFGEADLNLMQRLSALQSSALAEARAFEELDDYRVRLEEIVDTRTQELALANDEKARLLNQLEQRSRKFEEESRQDSLTGLANRRQLSERLEFELQRAATLGYPFAIAIADLDRFKAINDRHGHGVGDKVLQQAAELMQKHCRAADLVARYGGEEFVIALPGCDLEAAGSVAEAIREAFEVFDWERIHPGLSVTTSLGVAQWEGGQSQQGLFDTADARLYRAKEDGRNRVCA